MTCISASWNLCWFWGFLAEFFKFLAKKNFSSIRLGVRSRCLSIKRRILPELSYHFYSKFQLLSEWIWSCVSNFFIHFCSLPFLSSRLTHVNHSFNDFHVFGNLRNFDFALSCMDVLAINIQISFHWNWTLNFVKFNRTIFNEKKTLTGLALDCGLIQTFYLYHHSKGPETQKAFLTNQTTAHKTMLQITYSLPNKDSSRLVEQVFKYKLPYTNWS